MPTNKQLCLLHANCQGEPLARLLGLSAEFSRRWEVRHYTNYTRESIPDADLETCDLFLYQNLDQKWGDFSSASLLARLNPKARPICVPNLYFLGCWPFLTNDSVMDFGDSFLDRLIDQGVDKPAILKLYLHSDITRFIDLDAALAETFRIEEAKETHSAIKTVPLVREHWKRRMLFHTCNHPGKMLMGHLANGVLAELGIKPLPDALTDNFVLEYSDFDLPIHPQVAAYHGLDYGRQGHEFNVFNRPMTFERYVSRYIERRLQGLEDGFLAFLQLV